MTTAAPSPRKRLTVDTAPVPAWIGERPPRTWRKCSCCDRFFPRYYLTHNGRYRTVKRKDAKGIEREVKLELLTCYDCRRPHVVSDREPKPDDTAAAVIEPIESPMRQCMVSLEREGGTIRMTPVYGEDDVAQERLIAEWARSTGLEWSPAEDGSDAA